MSADVNESCKFQTLLLRTTVDYCHVKREEAASNVGITFCPIKPSLACLPNTRLKRYPSQISDNNGRRRPCYVSQVHCDSQKDGDG